MIAAMERPIRVLIWIPDGMLREIVREILAGQGDITLLPESRRVPDNANETDVAELDAEVRDQGADVVVTVIAADKAAALSRQVAAAGLVLISSDGRSAFAHTNNISADTIRGLVRSAGN